MGSQCGLRLCLRLNIRKNLKIFIEKGMVNDYCVLCVFGTVSVFGLKYGFRITQGFRRFIGKAMVNNYWMESEFGIEYVYRIVQGYTMES